MTVLYFAHLLGLVLVGVVSLLAAGWVRRQTRDRAGTAMIVLLVGHAATALLTAVRILSDSLAWQVAWYRLGFLVGIPISAVWFFLATYYTGRERWLTRPVRVAVAISIAVPTTLWLLDPFTHLLFGEFTLESEPFPYVVQTLSLPGEVAFGLLGFYPMIALFLFLQAFVFPRRHSRWKVAPVLAGILAIWLSFFLADASFVPAPGFSYTQYANGVFGVLVAISLFRTEFFAVQPLAHETIFEAIDDAILVVGARQTIVDFNDTAGERFPKLGAHVGDSLESVYPELLASSRSADGETAAIVDRIDRCADTPFAGSVRVETADGPRTHRITVSEISAGGEPRGYALMMRDVTDLECYALELEHKTDQLERFASVLSHDLRNPVAVARGYVELAIETDEVEHTRDALTALERIEETIDDLLTLAREGGTIDDAREVSLRRIVEDAWTTSNTRRLSLENAVDDAERLRADPSRLQTLLENLFRNAADHGASRVRVETLEADRGFAVEDDGPGIPPDERDRIFEYGYTSSPTGTGLGLSIVDSIATAHGWAVAVDESEAGGARFEFGNVERAYDDTGAGNGDTEGLPDYSEPTA